VPIGTARTLLRVSGTHVWVVALDRTENTRETVEYFRARFAGSALQFIPWFDVADFYNKTVALLTTQMNVVRLIIA